MLVAVELVDLPVAVVLFLLVGVVVPVHSVTYIKQHLIVCQAVVCC